MAGLPWIRLDTNTFDHPKMMMLKADRSFQAIALHIEAMTYSGKHSTDGFIPGHSLPSMQGRKVDAKKLVEAGLWIDIPGGYQIHGWDEYQLSSDEMKDRREKARKAAAARWAK